MNLIGEIGRSISSPVTVLITFALLTQIVTSINFESEMLTLEKAIDKLEDKNELSTNAAIPLARKMKAIMQYDEYQNISASLKTVFEDMKNRLPKSVKNLVFSPYVCLLNTLYDEFLWAAKGEEMGYRNDAERRSIYTGKVAGNNPELPKYKWYVHFIDDNTFELYSKPFQDKLFGDFWNLIEENKKRVVFAYRYRGSPTGTGVGSNVAWNPDVDGDAMHLKNDQTKEYLFADPENREGENRRYVYTYTPKVKLQGSKWEILDCSSSDETSAAKDGNPIF